MLRMRIIKLIVLFMFFALQSQFSYGQSLSMFSERVTGALASYFDIANGNTFVQVTNTSSTESATIHVQIFADLNNCVDRDFTDTLTPNETHVYDMSNLQSANGNPINFVLPAGSHGFVLINSNISDLVGNFRIVRNVGYEYRVNSAAGGSVPNEDLVARFTDNWGANQSDIVGVRVVEDTDPNLPDGTRDLTVQITDPFELFIFDNEETGTSCGEAIFGCDERPGDDDIPLDDDDLGAFTADFINQGINDIFPNTRGGLVLCSGDINTDGFIRLGGPTGFQLGQDLVGFIGLNDGASRGSMDRFKDITIPGGN